MNDQTGGWAVRKNRIAEAQLEQFQGTVAFPASAPKPEFSATQPDIPNNLEKVVPDFNHGVPDQYGFYTAFAGKPRKIGTTPFNSKIKGDGESQFQQPAPNAKGDDLMPADDGTPLRPSAMIKKMADSVKTLADSVKAHGKPADIDAAELEYANLMKMYYDIMRIFHVSQQRPLNSDERKRVAEYTQVIEQMLLKAPDSPDTPPDAPPDAPPDDPFRGLISDPHDMSITLGDYDDQKHNSPSPSLPFRSGFTSHSDPSPDSSFLSQDYEKYRTPRQIDDDAPIPPGSRSFAKLLGTLYSGSQTPFPSLEQSPAKDYQNMTLAELKYYFNVNNIEPPSGDKRQKQSWINALT